MYSKSQKQSFWYQCLIVFTDANTNKRVFPPKQDGELTPTTKIVSVISAVAKKEKIISAKGSWEVKQTLITSKMNGVGTEKANEVSVENILRLQFSVPNLIRRVSNYMLLAHCILNSYLKLTVKHTPP